MLLDMDLARRFGNNPLFRIEDVPPLLGRDRSSVVEGIFNPGVFRFNGRVHLLLRVAERPVTEQGSIGTYVHDASAPHGIRIVEFRRDDPKLKDAPPYLFYHDGVCYLTTLSYLRLASSDDGERFTLGGELLFGEGPLEDYGIEDCRVSQIEQDYVLTYTAVSNAGAGVGLRTTRDFATYRHHGMVMPPPNKDVALFEQKINGRYACLHRPSPTSIGGPYIWYAESPDLDHWGNHHVVIAPQPGWEALRIGAGAAPIATDEGFLAIYHGADGKRYCLGALLLDKNEPWRVLARSKEPIMEPIADYERSGFVSDVVFANGQTIDGDTVTVYYGGGDAAVCGCRFSISEILGSLH